MSLVRLRAIWITNHPPSELWHCWLGHLTCKNIVSEMTETVSSGTLNLPYSTKHTQTPWQSVLYVLLQLKVTTQLLYGSWTNTTVNVKCVDTNESHWKWLLTLLYLNWSTNTVTILPATSTNNETTTYFISKDIASKYWNNYSHNNEIVCLEQKSIAIQIQSNTEHATRIAIPAG